MFQKHSIEFLYPKISIHYILTLQYVNLQKTFVTHHLGTEAREKEVSDMNMGGKFRKRMCLNPLVNRCNWREQDWCVRKDMMIWHSRTCHNQNRPSKLCFTSVCDEMMKLPLTYPNLLKDGTRSKKGGVWWRTVMCSKRQNQHSLICQSSSTCSAMSLYNKIMQLAENDLMHVCMNHNPFHSFPIHSTAFQSHHEISGTYFPW